MFYILIVLVVALIALGGSAEAWRHGGMAIIAGGPGAMLMNPAGTAMVMNPAGTALVRSQ